MRSIAFALALFAAVAGAHALPPTSKEECLARHLSVGEALLKLPLSDEMRERIEEELERARSSCVRELFEDAERALDLAERLARGEPDPE